MIDNKEPEESVTTSAQQTHDADTFKEGIFCFRCSGSNYLVKDCNQGYSEGPVN